jgi:hypothetical protein
MVSLDFAMEKTLNECFLTNVTETFLLGQPPTAARFQVLIRFADLSFEITPPRRVALHEFVVLDR